MISPSFLSGCWTRPAFWGAAEDWRDMNTRNQHVGCYINFSCSKSLQPFPTLNTSSTWTCPFILFATDKVVILILNCHLTKCSIDTIFSREWCRVFKMNSCCGHIVLTPHEVLYMGLWHDDWMFTACVKGLSKSALIWDFGPWIKALVNYGSKIVVFNAIWVDCVTRDTQFFTIWKEQWRHSG